MTLPELLGVELPIIQAPMAGVQGSALAIAVANVGGLGSLPCATLSSAALRAELETIARRAQGSVNVNFFCHTPPVPDPARERAWRAALAPYYAEYGIDPDAIPVEPGRVPFDAERAAVLADFRPAVVSFHFGLPSDELLARFLLALLPSLADAELARGFRITAAVATGARQDGDGFCAWLRSSGFETPRIATAAGCR